MGTEQENEKIIDEILREAYREIEPPDSWQALRCRIDQRIDGQTSVLAKAIGNVVFWRRLAIGMAACFLVTTGILLYCFGLSNGGRQSQDRMAGAENLLSQADINRLSFTFSQVRQLFGRQAYWIMIGSDNSTQMGVADTIPSGADSKRLIVVRLAASLDGLDSQRQYFDIVTVADRRAELRLPVAGASPIDISLHPTVKSDGTIAVEINTQASRVNRILDDRFTSLVRARADGNWVNIVGMGRVLTEI